MKARVASWFTLAMAVTALAARAEPQRFEYNCQNRPFAYPKYERPGLKGRCSTMLQGGGALVHEAKNTPWALWKLAYDLCVNRNVEIQGLTYECAWVPRQAE